MKLGIGGSRAIVLLGAVLNSGMWAQEVTPAAPSASQSTQGGQAAPTKQTPPENPSQQRDKPVHDNGDSSDRDGENRGWLPPGEDPENRLISPFLKHLAGDQASFWTSPAHLRIQDLRWIVPAAGITAGFIASDSWMSRQVPAAHVARSKSISNYAVYSLIGVTGGSYLLGHLTKNEHLQEAGFLGGEAAINSTAVDYVFKEITRRPRPYQGNGNGTFFQGGTSFPSEHAAVAWSAASVWAHEYPGALSQIFAYGLASAVTVSRVTAKQHFPSDAVIGSALGWYFGRQVYRAHHDTELGGAPWGGLLPERGAEKSRNPDNMGSPYLPLDSWVYPALERLSALGYTHTAYLGIRPWTRMECARLLQEARERVPGADEENGIAAQTLADLEGEFLPEASRLDGAPNLGASLDSVYTRVTSISGRPLRDGFHFGQTIINDYGRPYGEGFNNVIGFSSHAVAGPFSFSVQGEYQHSPSVASDPLSVLQATATQDGGVKPLPDGSPIINRFRLIEGSVGFTFRSVKVSFGKQNLWLGPGESGPLLLSDNAEPITMLQIDNVSPFEVPLLSRFLGPARMNFFVGQLSGQNWVYNPPVAVGLNSTPDPRFFVGPNFSPQPFIHGNKVSFRPTENLEFGLGVTAIFGGPGLPFTWHEFFRSYYGHNVNTATNPAKRFSGFDLTYRVPGLRKWLTFYTDSLVGDEISPLGSTRPMLNPGIYFPQLPKLPKLELRFEGFKAEPRLGTVYFDRRYRSGYTNDGTLVGSWIGRQALGGQVWAKYSFTARRNLQFGYRHQEVDRFLLSGGHVNDFSASGEYMLGSRVSLSGRAQYEEWNFRVLSTGKQSNVMAQFQVSFSPGWRFRR
jgi:hypothetical protein